MKKKEKKVEIKKKNHPERDVRSKNVTDAGSRMTFYMFRYYLLSTLYCFWTLQLARMIHMYVCVYYVSVSSSRKHEYEEKWLFWEIVYFPDTAAYEKESQKLFAWIIYCTICTLMIVIRTQLLTRGRAKDFYVRRFLAIHSPLLCQQEED